MAETFYVQCTLRNENTFQVAWIPERFAVIGRKLVIGKNEPGAALWTVTCISDGRKPGSYLAEHERDFKSQRKASDI